MKMKNSTVKQRKAKSPRWGFGGLLLLTLLPTLLTAQNGIVISNFSVSAGTITLDLSWKKVGMPDLWLDSAWVFVDYNNNGVMKRLPLAAGAILTATSAP
jgi:hypothetical protein